jgi:hypothetical protein
VEVRGRRREGVGDRVLRMISLVLWRRGAGMNSLGEEAGSVEAHRRARPRCR